LRNVYTGNVRAGGYLSSLCLRCTCSGCNGAGRGAARERTRYARAVRQVVQSVGWYASGGKARGLRAAIGKAKKSDKGKRKPTPTP